MNYCSVFKKIFLLALLISFVSGCDLLTPPEIAEGGSDNFGDSSNDTVFLVREDVGSFESMLISNSGYMVGVKKDSSYNHVVYMDSIAVSEQSALVAYIDSIGRIHKLYHNGDLINVSYKSGSDKQACITYTNDKGNLETEIINLSSKSVSTRAGDVLDPYDIFSLATVGKDAAEIMTALAKNKKFNTELVNQTIATGEAIAAFSYGNTVTTIGLASIAILSAATTPALIIASVLGIIDIANAVINDWQNMISDIYFGSLVPVTGDAVQLSDKHFVINYTLNNVEENKTNFNVGVIISNGLLITKNHCLIKKSIPYSSKDEGRIIIDTGSINAKFGDKLKYRIFVEPADNNGLGIGDNGFEWDDKILDYWKYGEVKTLEIGEPRIKVVSSEQTKVESNNGHNYIFSFDVDVLNDIPFDVDEWGVAIYETFSDSCDNVNDWVDKKILNGKGVKTSSFTININGIFMNEEHFPYVPMMNYFAIPYVSFDGHTYAINKGTLHKVALSYQPEAKAKIVEIYESKFLDYYGKLELSYDIEARIYTNQKIEHFLKVNSDSDFAEIELKNDQFDVSTGIQEITYALKIKYDVRGAISNQFIFNVDISIQICSDAFPELMNEPFVIREIKLDNNTYYASDPFDPLDPLDEVGNRLYCNCPADVIESITIVDEGCTEEYTEAVHCEDDHHNLTKLCALSQVSAIQFDEESNRFYFEVKPLSGHYAYKVCVHKFRFKIAWKYLGIATYSIPLTVTLRR